MEAILKSASELNKRIALLHDELNALVLTASNDFPAQASDGFELLQGVAELHVTIAVYIRELLVRLFRSLQPESPSEMILSGIGPKFLELWSERARLSNADARSESDLDSSIRRLVALLCEQTTLMGEDDFRSAVEDGAGLSEVLYYLITIEGNLAWYAGRYLDRLAGRLKKT
jgi:uncharacterized small protein (DUF1192 family)